MSATGGAGDAGAGADVDGADDGSVVLAVDIGGTKLAAGLVDGRGTLLVRRQVATGRETDGDALYGRLRGVLDEVLSSDEGRAAPTPLAVGVGSGGPMAPAGETVSPLNIPAWRDYPLRARLAETTGWPAFVDNDAKALALGEGWVGAAAGETDFLAMVVSTGVGGGIVLDGRLLDGAGGNAGHIGHVVVDPEGRRCACGSRGCLEAEAAGPMIQVATGRPAAEAGPEVIERTGVLVGRAIANVAALLDLKLALVAGSVALGFGDPFFAAAQREIDERACISYARGTVVRPGGLRDAGPLVGAAAVGWRGLGRQVLSSVR